VDQSVHHGHAIAVGVHAHGIEVHAFERVAKPSSFPRSVRTQNRTFIAHKTMTARGRERLSGCRDCGSAPFSEP